MHRLKKQRAKQTISLSTQGLLAAVGLMSASQLAGLTPECAHIAYAQSTSQEVASTAPPQQSPPPSLLPMVNADQLHGHIQFLSDDLLQGRGPGTDGDRLTQLYLATQYRTLGLRKLPSMESYLQPFPLVGVLSKPAKQWQFTKDGESLGEPFEFFQDYIVSAGELDPVVTIQNADVVFVGYGIQAPEYQWDDFKDTDVRGKILVVMNNDPESAPDLFAGSRRLYYGRWSYKYEMAAKLGAAGVIIIHTDYSAGYPFGVLQSSALGEDFELGDSKNPRLPLKAWMTNDACTRLVSSAGFDLDELRRKAESRDFKPISLGIQLSTQISVQSNKRETANVIGMIEGSDEKLKDEYVVFMAHHDHLGLAASRNEKGDNSYNGAIDNASGTAALLAMAQAFAKNEHKTKRSLIFAAVGAEEQGLLGSQYFAENCPVPVGKIAALVNMDALNAIGVTKDVNVIGAGKSSLDQLIAQAAQRQGRVIVPDRDPSKGYYYRSDQFSLAKVGVPGVYLHTGHEVIGKPAGWGKEQLDAWVAEHYHQLSDEYQSDWDLEGAVADIRLLMDVAWQAANAPELQAWKPGDEFEAARIRSIREAAELP